MTTRKTPPAIGEYEELWRVERVEQMTGLSRSTIYAKMAEGEFPEARRVSAQAVAWLMSEVLEWMRALPKAGRKAGTPPKSPEKDSTQAAA
jgi:prophage regulatory protein